LEKSLLHGKAAVSSVRFLLLAALLSAGIAEASMIGGESGAYLRYPAGASALAMGGAWSAAPLGLSSWWNPALTGSRKERAGTLGAGFRSLGQTDGFGAIEFRVPPRVGMGLAVLYRGDPLLNNLYDENENPIGNAAYTSITGKIALSYLINRRLSAGFTVSILFEQLPSDYFDGRVSYASATSIGSFDFALAYRHSDHLTLSAQLRETGAALNWNFVQAGYDYTVPNDDRLLPVLVLGSSYSGSLLNKPLIWNMDVRGWFFDGTWKKLDRPQASLATGFEWRNWKAVYLRAGLGEVLLNGDIIADSPYYWRNFGFRLAGGISVDCSRIRKGLQLNYGCSTDRVWAGIDQQLDFTYVF
jgi:hypothetical protein